MAGKNFSSDVVINDILNEVLKSIKKSNEIFLSEDDFKFSFAQAVAKVKGVENIILEYPIKTKDLYSGREDIDIKIKNSFLRMYFGGKKCKNCRMKKELNCSGICEKSKYYCDMPRMPREKCENCGILGCPDMEKKYKKDRSFIDISFKYEESRYFVELKYKIAETTAERHGDRFELSHQGAANNGLYYIYEDIERMEAIKSSKNESKIKTFVILITNDHLYWTKKGQRTNVFNVRLDQKQEEKIDFESKEEYELTTLKDTIAYKNSKVYQRILHIDRNYIGKFVKFKKTESERNNVFACLVIDLNNPVKKEN